MMAAKRKTAGAKNPLREKPPNKAPSSPAKEKNPSITPKQRWQLITEGARTRAQKRGFIGGDPVEDWLEAEREVDARYITDFEKIFSVTETSEIIEHIKGIFAGHGLSQREFSEFIDRQRGGLKSLARINHELVEGTSEFAAQQAALLQESVRESVNILKALTHGELDTAGVARQARLSMKAMENVLSRVKSMTKGTSTASQDFSKDKVDTGQSATAPGRAAVGKKPKAKTGTRTRAGAKTRAETKGKTKSPAKRPAGAAASRRPTTAPKRK